MLQKIAFLLAISLPSLALADTFTYSYIFGEKKVGHLTAETKGAQTTINYDVKNNGRGPTIAESITLDTAGLPIDWAQSSSPWANGVYARALLKAPPCSCRLCLAVWCALKRARPSTFKEAAPRYR